MAIYALNHEPTSRARLRSTVALMFHAIGDGVVDGQHAYYTLPRQNFAAILADMANRGRSGVSAALWRDSRIGTILSFDDGHQSNYTDAFPLLFDYGMCADFFVNPATVGTPGFVSWAQLREMNRHGMSIQSHGYHHRYLTEYTPLGLRDNLRTSRLVIEDKIGGPVTLLAPPGGRVPPKLAETAKACGYSAVFTSRPGFVRDTHGSRLQPRFAVTSTTSLESVARWVDGALLPVVALVCRYAALAAAKRVLGNSIYDRARARLIQRDEVGL